MTTREVESMLVKSFMSLDAVQEELPGSSDTSVVETTRLPSPRVVTGAAAQSASKR